MAIDKSVKRKNKLYQIVKSFFTIDIRAKITILLITLFIWVITALNNEYSYTFDVKLDVVNVKEGKILKNLVPGKVKAKFTGRGLDLIYLLIAPSSSFKFVLDIQRINYYYKFDLNSYFVGNPEKIIYPRKSNIAFNQIVWPDSVEIVLDKYVRKELLIVPVIKINVAPGYMKIGDLEINPDTVTVEGPHSYLKEIVVLTTESKVINNAIRDVKEKLKIIKPVGYNIRLSHEYVECYQKVDLISELVVKDIPVKILNKPADVEIYSNPPVVNVKLVSAVSILKEANKDDIEVTWDYRKQYRRGVISYQPLVKVPNDIISYEVIPDSIELRIIRSR
ncbi:MAG: hypothetical protein H0Z29_00315 [Candidatus Marinimicrobia bacterium]|nr:hypothetical protein [Candidatus Neomarinimicrobiota bacterium]